jgi:hypothetical protein
MVTRAVLLLECKVEIKAVVVAQVQATLAAAAAKAVNQAHAADKVECNFTKSLINAETKLAKLNRFRIFQQTIGWKLIKVPPHIVGGLICSTNKLLVMKDRDEKNKRFESYPKPSETDRQFDNQPEFIDESPNKSEDEGKGDRPITKVSEKEDERESWIVNHHS